ncbi:MAG: phage portal protein [Burkholderiaceae bacterium]|nr:phage portal protein [Burkholderiaceae bacterium]
MSATLRERVSHWWLERRARKSIPAFERLSALWGSTSQAGVAVNAQTAMQSAAVYSCVQVLAQSIGMLPLCVYAIDDAGIRRRARHHRLWALLQDQPNSFQTAVEFFEMMSAHLCLRGNAYALINRNAKGQILELIPLHPDQVSVQMQTDYRLRYGCTLEGGQRMALATGDVFHVRGLTLNGWLGISPIAYAREAIGLAMATERFGATLFRNGAKMGGVLEHPGKISKEAADRLRSSFDEAHNGENAHRTAILEEGLKWSKVSMTADDSQFLETRKYQRSEIAAIFRVPPHMIGDLERATFSNIEQQSLEFVNFTLMPWLHRIEKAIRRDLLTPAERTRMMARFNVANLLRGDAAARAAYYQSGIQQGWMTRNEARHAESDLGVMLNPLEGLDEPLLPLNMISSDRLADRQPNRITPDLSTSPAGT